MKVVDRRWFTPEGELKDPAPKATPEPAPPPSPPTAAPPAQTESTQPPKAAAEQPPSEAGFMDLVDFLAQQAVALLSGQIPGRGRDPVMARFFIDLLGVVQEKTSGQLAPEESRYLEDILYQLRSLFMAATR